MRYLLFIIRGRGDEVLTFYYQGQGRRGTYFLLSGAGEMRYLLFIIRGRGDEVLTFYYQGQGR